MDGCGHGRDGGVVAPGVDDELHLRAGVGLGGRPGPTFDLGLALRREGLVGVAVGRERLEDVREVHVALHARGGVEVFGEEECRLCGHRECC